MGEEIKAKLADFHKFNDMARKLFSASELIPGQPVKVHTLTDLMESSKWRTKANIALNEFHQLLASEVNTFPYNISELEKEKVQLEAKLKETEDWLSNNS
ncbi:MAG: hypothetical protein JWO96_603 [Candidatus Saccharibacteria bacterium]|nr:hypothetical protein [Candidatus Saccharibacteria bacterium]